jgi:putative SOS response-associated peptidase YedK
LADLQALLRPIPASAMRIYAVSTRVNSVKNDEPSLIDPVAVPPLAQPAN